MYEPLPITKRCFFILQLFRNNYCVCADSNKRIRQFLVSLKGIKTTIAVNHVILHLVVYSHLHNTEIINSTFNAIIVKKNTYTTISVCTVHKFKHDQVIIYLRFFMIANACTMGHIIEDDILDNAESGTVCP